MSAEEINDIDILWVLSLFINGELVHETFYNRFLKDSQDKETDLEKFEIVHHVCSMLVLKGYAKSTQNERGGEITVLKPKCRDLYKEIKNKEEQKNPKEEKIKWWKTSFMKDVFSNTTGTILASLILFLVGSIWLMSQKLQCMSEKIPSADTQFSKGTEVQKYIPDSLLKDSIQPQHLQKATIDTCKD